MADTPPELLAQFASALGIDAATATPDAVLATLNTRLGEHNAAVSEVTKIKGERNAERIDSAISAALGKSPMIQANTPDAMNLMRPLFAVDDKGRVVTKGGDTGEASGMDPSQFVAGRLGTLRSHWFAPSQGGGAKGGGIASAGADVSCFRTGNVTEQMALIGSIGERAAIDACRRSGIAPPAWLLKGAGR